MLCEGRKTLTIRTKDAIVKGKADWQFEEIHIGFCGPLKTCISGKRYILTIIDQYSRYIPLTAVTNQDEKTTRDVLLNKWIYKYGYLKIIENSRVFTYLKCEELTIDE